MSESVNRDYFAGKTCDVSGCERPAVAMRSDVEEVPGPQVFDAKRKKNTRLYCKEHAPPPQ